MCSEVLKGHTETFQSFAKFLDEKAAQQDTKKTCTYVIIRKILIFKQKLPSLSYFPLSFLSVKDKRKTFPFPFYPFPIWFFPLKFRLFHF